MAARATKPPDYVDDLYRHFIRHPLVQTKIAISPSMAAGAVELAARRGEQEGIYCAYTRMRRRFPAAAAFLLEEFGMDKSGNLDLGNKNG